MAIKYSKVGNTYYKTTSAGTTVKITSSSQIATAKSALAGSSSSSSSSSSGSSSSSSSSSTPSIANVGLTPAQVELLKNTPGISQSALGNYVSSGAVNTSGTPQTNTPSTDLKNLSIGLAGGTAPATTTSAGQETPAQTVARVTQQSGNAVIPSTGTSQDLTNLSVGLAQNTTPTTPGAQQGMTPEEYAKSIVDAMQGMTSTYSPDQSTQGQQQTNDQVMGATMGGVGGGTPGAGSVTTASGGYTKIGPAYFQKSSDGLRAVSDASIIKGLKAGTIPYSTGQLDGTTFSKYSVPLADPAKQALADASLRAMGLPAEGDVVNEGASLMTTYQGQSQKYGLTQTQSDFFTDPMKTISDITSQIFKASGMDEANTAIKDITGELEDLENKRDDEIANINDNPWLTEGVRLRQIASVESRYEDKINNRTNKLRLLEDVRNNAQQSAQFAIGTAISLWDKERTFQQNQIDSWNEQAQNEFNNKIKLAELSMKGSGNSTIDEYLFAVENGFQGDIIDYQSSVASATRAPSPEGANGLTPAQINATVNSIAGAFDNEPIVKNYNTVQEGYNTIKAIGINTKNPADDQAFIYAFAKIMDPNSVVREGEYNTVQRYAQSWADNFGFDVKRIYSNSNFLTPQAKQNMLNALQPKVSTITTQYKSLYNQYQQRVDQAKSGGFNSITDYSQGNQGTSDGSSIPGIQNLSQTPGLMSVAPQYKTSSGLGYTVY